MAVITAMNRLKSAATRPVATISMSTRALYAAKSGARDAAHGVPGLGCGAAACALSTVSVAAPSLACCSAAVSCRGSVPLNGENYGTLIAIGRCGRGDPQATRMVEIGERCL